MPKLILATCLSLILAGCVSTGLWPPWGPSPAEKHFIAGLEEWNASNGDPAAFDGLINHYPESPFTAAAEALVDCAHRSKECREENAQRVKQFQALEKRHVKARQDLEQEQQLNSDLTGRLKELEANLEKFKQILIETEQYSP